MTNRNLIPLMVLGLVLAGVSVLADQDNTPEAMIGRARAAVLNPGGSCDAITKALSEVLDASLLILPKAEYADEFKTRISFVRSEIGKGELFSDKARQHLGLAYKLVAGGSLWQVPEELKSAGSAKKGIERATEICVELLDSAAAERKAGNDEKAVRRLIEFVLLVVTPIEA